MMIPNKLNDCLSDTLKPYELFAKDFPDKNLLTAIITLFRISKIISEDFFATQDKVQFINKLSMIVTEKNSQIALP